MDIKNLIMACRVYKEQMVNALKEYVRENGEEMNDDFYNEFGMCEEDEEGVKIVKVLNLSDTGCRYSCQNEVNDKSLADSFESQDNAEDLIADGFHHYDIATLYIVRDSEGNESFRYYMFYSNGVSFKDDSEPDCDNVESLGLEDLHYIFEAITKSR